MDKKKEPELVLRGSSSKGNGSSSSSSSSRSGGKGDDDTTGVNTGAVVDTTTAATARTAVVVGADHAVILTGDHGPCVLFHEHAGTKNAQAATRKKPWRDERLRFATLLLNEGSPVHGCYRPGQDIVIPTTVVSTAVRPLGCDRIDDNSGGKRDGVGIDTAARHRTHLVFLAGATSSKVRARIVDAFVGDTRVFEPHRLPHTEYLCAMAASRFCLCPRGHAAWSPRLAESLYAGCVPVIVSDQYDPPFSDVLDYTKFSVRIAQADYLTLADKLAAYSDTQVDRLLINGRAVRPLFRYLHHSGDSGDDDGGTTTTTPTDKKKQQEKKETTEKKKKEGGESYAGDDVTEMVMFELWLRVTAKREQQQ